MRSKSAVLAVVLVGQLAVLSAELVTMWAPVSAVVRASDLMWA